MRRIVCGVCRKPVTNQAVRLDLATIHGANVTVIAHEICAPKIQGEIAYQMRQNAIELRTKIDANQIQIRGIQWTPSLIRAVRQRLGLTQAEFAQRLGYNRQSVYLHERPESEPWLGISGIMCALEQEACLLTGATLTEWLAKSHPTASRSTNPPRTSPDPTDAHFRKEKTHAS